jgi:hypothetical protein
MLIIRVQSTLDDYSEVPIEAFGEAMLRGMGWKPDAPRTGPGVHVPQRRPEGLGLGATARAAPIDDKGKKAKRKEDAKSRGGRGYVPVVKRERVSQLIACPYNIPLNRFSGHAFRI